MTGFRRALVGLGVLAFVLGALGGLLVLTGDHVDLRGLQAVSIVVVAWSFAGTGLYAWYRRPESRIGPLMVAVAFAWLLNSLGGSESGYVFVFGFAFGTLAWGFLIHLIVSFPNGRLEGRLERAVVAVTYFGVTVPQIVQVPFIDPPRLDGCEDCPSNPFLIEHSETVVGAATSVVAVLGVLVLVGLFITLRRKLRRASPNQRRAIAAVLWTGSIALGIQIVNLAVFIIVGGSTQGIYLAGLLPFAAVPFAFLVGLLRTRLSQGEAVSTLVARLGRGENVRHAIAESLGDPTIELAYWLPSSQTYVDSAGRPVELADCCTPVDKDGRPIAAIMHDRGLAQEHDLIRSVGAAAALALENERLDAELRARLVELQASRARIVQAADDERRRLERDLHDGAQQRLVALALNLRLARSRLEGDPAMAGELLDEAIGDLAHATDELRDFARGIHPAILTDRGLGEALHLLADRAPVPVEIIKAPTERLPGAVESTAYYVISEALTNVAKYADATHAQVSVDRVNGRVEVRVRDDGRGGADALRGSGLRGLADRVAALDGSFEIDSPAGAGTTISASIPCA